VTHEPLPTSVVGSHAHPGWFAAGIEAAARGDYGPADLAELLDDGVDLAIRDQERARIDIVSDGEMRRAGFFTAEFYRHLTGVRALAPERRLGIGAHDGLHRFAVDAPIEAPNGLGVVEEYLAARPRTQRPLKVTLPGPFTLSGRLATGPGTAYPTRVAAAEAFVPILQSELRRLVDAGAAIIQVDEPSPAIHPDASADFAALLNEAIRPAVGRARLGAHLCFGNFLGRPLAPRSYRPILAAMLRFDVDELVLEFANREMSEIGILREIADAGRDVAAGVVDVKSSHVETPEEVAVRADAVLATGVDPGRLTLVPDCGFSQTARHLTVGKLAALVVGRDLVLGRRAEASGDARAEETPGAAARPAGAHDPVIEEEAISR
jgi:5-methyltetrahydropteroyltriglutamate--homocysteine methyltransferase